MLSVWARTAAGRPLIVVGGRADAVAGEDVGAGALAGGAAGAPRVARTMQEIEKLVQENAVVIFSRSGCCMCHVVKRLFCNLGVGPTVHELDERVEGADMEKVLRRLALDASESESGSGKATAPAALPIVFVGGKLVGGLDAVMAAHLSGTLVPRLKEAGALWL